MSVAPSRSSPSSLSTPTPPNEPNNTLSDGADTLPTSTRSTSSDHLRSYLQFSDLRTKRIHIPDAFTSVVREAGTMRLDSHPIDHPLSFHPVLCSDCVSDRQEEVYVIPKVEPPLVEKCTEECALAPCNKETLCFDDICLEETCDMQPCDGGTTCMGYEDLLQCCTDDHAYYGVNNDPASSNLSWDVAFENFFKDDRVYPNIDNSRIPHTQNPSIGKSGSRSQQASSAASIGDPQNSDFNSDLQGCGLQFNSSRQPEYYQVHEQQRVYSIQASQSHGATSLSSEPFACRWSGCRKSFNTMNDLVGHVNLSHLRPPDSSSSPSSPLMGQIGIQCQWDKCNIFSPSTTLPGPSAGLGPDALYNMLENHFMREHLPPQNFSASFTAEANSSFDVPQHWQQQGFLGPEGGNAQLQVQPQPPHQYVLQDRLSHHSHSQSNPQMSSHPHSPNRGGAPLSQPLNTTSSPEPDTEVEVEGTGPPHNCEKFAHVCHWIGCAACSFTSCDALTTHVSAEHVGSGKSQYHCHWEGCTRHGEQGFSSKQKILRHLQSHTGHRPFQCKICQQNFSEAATLQQHMRRHTQEKPFVCDFPGCGKAFTITGALTIHRRTHNGERPFKCPHCDKAFAESSNLSKHLKTHTGDRPYRCPENCCDKRFARPDQLTRHMNVHTKKRALEERR